jgi:hypothetical protein
MITLLSIVIKSLNSKIKILILNHNLFKNLKKWKDKPLNFKLISIESDKKKLN